MAEAARSAGYKYLAVTDHSKHATIAHGLDAKRLSAELDQINRLNDELSGIELIRSWEVDILADGKLDLPASILKRLAPAISGHSKFPQKTPKIVNHWSFGFRRPFRHASTSI